MQNHIVVLSGVRGDTRRYRSFHPYEQLCFADVPCELAHVTDPDLEAKISRASTVILHRTTYDPFVARLLESIKQRKGLVIADVDDLVFDPNAFEWISSPDFQDPRRAALYQEDMRRNQTTLQACHAVLASTKYLAERVKALSLPAWIHRNSFSLEMLALSERAYKQKKNESDRLIVGYASGTPTHDRDFAVAKPALAAILQRYPHVEIWLVGPLDPGDGWGLHGDRVKRHKLVPWRQLPDLLAQFDINIAPLVIDNPFGQSKSEIKYTEAGLVRVPTIASPTEAFSYAIRSGENGYLAASFEAWQEALITLIEGEDHRESLAQAAHQDVLHRYHPQVRSAELIRTLKEIHQYVYHKPVKGLPPPSPEIDTHEISHFPDVSPVTQVAEQSLTLTRMARYTLRHRGARTMLAQVRVYVRRLLSPLFPYRGK